MEPIIYNKKKARRIHLILIGCVLIFFLALSVYVTWYNLAPRKVPHLGVTFSTVYAEELGLDWKEVYIASLDELKVRDYRIPVYWSELEPVEGEYDWEALDFIVSNAESRGAKITMAIGQKVPRWPECFIPDWAEKGSAVAANEALLKTMEQIIARYGESEAIKSWQVENEYFFPFGVCPQPRMEFIKNEVELVKSQSDKPITFTVSGELEPFNDLGFGIDIIGVSMYRITWNDFFGYFFYPLTPGFYRLKSLITSPTVDKVIISELQAEPWFNKPIEEMTDEERAKAFEVELFEKNIDFASRTGIGEVYLWGIEWWYAQKERGDAALWNYARELFVEEFEQEAG